jgi:hypothetical protein
MTPLTTQFIQFIFSVGVAIIAFALTRVFQNKPKLVAFYGHVSELVLKNPDGTEFRDQTGCNVTVRSHSITIINIGKTPATEVKIVHGILPLNYTIFPPISYNKEGTEITIPSLAPNEQISITYLYYPPLHVSQINVFIKCTECLSIPGNMQHVQVIPNWVKCILYALIFMGTVTSIYFLTTAISCFYNGCILHQAVVTK